MLHLTPPSLTHHPARTYTTKPTHNTVSYTGTAPASYFHQHPPLHTPRQLRSPFEHTLHIHHTGSFWVYTFYPYLPLTSSPNTPPSPLPLPSPNHPALHHHTRPHPCIQSSIPQPHPPSCLQSTRFFYPQNSTCPPRAPPHLGKICLLVVSHTGMWETLISTRERV